MTDPLFTDVLIVGAGSVGLALNTILARHGIACRIIDQRPNAEGVSTQVVHAGLHPFG